MNELQKPLDHFLKWLELAWHDLGFNLQVPLMRNSPENGNKILAKDVLKMRRTTIRESIPEHPLSHFVWRKDLK